MSLTERLPEIADTLESGREPNSSEAVLRALEESEKAFHDFGQFCQSIDRIYSLSTRWTDAGFTDQEFELFWASMEILKPAIYAKPPKPIASPRFKDCGKVEKTAAELIERCLESEFDRGHIDQVMLGIRDDLAMTNRGVGWVTYESDAKGGGQRVCIEHLDRADFLHEPAMSWAQVGWVARRAWLTRRQMRKRFPRVDEADIEKASYENRRDERDNGSVDGSNKAGVWEVWSRTDNRVYWVTEGVPIILDEDEPHLSLRDFFPCPRPAYGTLNRRSLIPVPDYRRYGGHLEQINELTTRIYTLLRKVRLKVLVPAGGDIGNAVEAALQSEDDSIVIPVPAAAFQGQGSGNIMLTLPLADVATTIQGLIEARGQLIEDFYQLSGISDIMRGATEAQETLGAQQLKTQYGSVRVRDKIDEVARVAKDMAAISAEIMSANFSPETLLSRSRMTIPKRAEIKRKTEEVEEAAKGELEALAGQVEQMAGQGDPAQMDQQFEQQQQAILAKYQTLLTDLGNTVVIEDVMDMLRDEKVRNLVIDIETDSTILIDEGAEKAARAEFLNAFATASTALAPLAQSGPAGADLAGAMLKFSLSPYRANRELDDLVDAWVDEMKSNPQQQGGESEAALIEAQNKLAEAESQKAQAAMMNVQAKAAKDQAENERKIMEITQRAEADRRKMMAEAEKLRQSAEANLVKADEALAKVDLIRAQTMKALAEAGVAVNSQQLDESKSLKEIELRETDQAMSAQRDQRAAVESDRSAAMGERQQEFTERNTDRQQTFAERQAASTSQER